MPFAPPVTATTLPATFIGALPLECGRVCHTDGMSEKSYEASVVIGAATARAPTLVPRVRRRHHADLAAPSRPGATILVMLVAASALRRVACGQRQARRVSGQETLARESIGRRAGGFAWNYRYRVELR